MRKVLRKVSMLALLLLTIACERDDICAEGTPTTPRVLIGFYDIANQDEFKPVSRLTAYGEDLVLDENGQPTQPVTNSAATLVFNTNTTELALPLLVGTEGDEVVTRFVLEQSTNFRLDDNANTSSNEDILELRYKPQFVYVSRACGYKSVFTELEVVPISDPDNWIINVVINENINGTVENENTIHVQIFH
ncbi:DUF6452 family protein [uncultured Winogradskyella sp.]|uniref:DUF6452 family protein n=1 Tax=uncultured Winogradskyella sp. TaxID=395353 RepID=UPI003514D1BD